MKRFTFGADKIDQDPWGIRFKVGAKYVVEADRYRIEPGFVTFYRGDDAILSIPASRVPVVGELTDDDDLPFKVVE